MISLFMLNRRQNRDSVTVAYDIFVYKIIYSVKY